MSYRYSSVDRSKEIKLRKTKNSLHFGGNLILGTNDLDINKILYQKRNTSIKATNSKKFYPKKLPSINKTVKNPHLLDKFRKISQLSTTVNLGASFENDNSKINNNKYLNTESNHEEYKLRNYFNLVISSNYSDRTSINNTQSSLLTNIIKPIVIKENDPLPHYSKIPNNRLYQRNQPDKYNNYSNSLKMLIKEIKNKDNSKISRNIFLKKKINPIQQTNVAFAPKYENEVLDANRIINNYKFKENELLAPDDDTNDFLSTNKKISINNMLIELMHNVNQKCKDYNEKRNKTIQQSEDNIEKDKKDFDDVSFKQRELYFKISDLCSKIHEKNIELMKLLYYYRTREKTLEDEIFKKIEQIESLRIYAKFVHKVLGGSDKLFEGDLIPNYENDNRPDINILIKKIYDIYGHLLKKHKLSINSNFSNDKEKIKRNQKSELRLSDSQIDDEIDIDLLNDPDLMIRKFKEIEDQILRIVEKTKMYNKYELKEEENNKEFIKDLKRRIKTLENEYEIEKKALNDYKINEFGKTSDITEEDFCIMAKDLSKTINQCFNEKNINEEKNKKSKKKKMAGIDILELNDEITKSMNIMIKKESQINGLLAKIDYMEKNEKKIFDEVMNKRKIEVKMKNQKKIRENINNIEINKRNKVEERINKIIIQSRKYHPSILFEKKDDKPKEDESEIIRKENENLLIYH